MGAFTLDISNPLPNGFTGGLGGPGQGGHTGPDWFEAFGNDLGAPAGAFSSNGADRTLYVRRGSRRGSPAIAEAPLVALRTEAARASGSRSGCDVLEAVDPQAVGLLLRARSCDEFCWTNVRAATGLTALTSVL